MMKILFSFLVISNILHSTIQKDCSVNEKFNKLGPGLCETHKDCKGDRACSLIGKCFGKSNCKKKINIIYKSNSCYNKETGTCKSD